jgi:hypothetical protein
MSKRGGAVASAS